ncbi:hypothetical protein VSR68_26375 [Paraburkholderia phymatum]|uniref:hypothetical protein n=1 Tax=Paraburkholderia phymatum TaxID=148447 RepID=UPI0031824838
MSALIIKDLSVAEELDSEALKSVRGGYLANPLFPSLSFLFDNSKTINAPQFVQQQMNITNVGGNSNSTTQIIPMMTAGNSIVMN